MGSRYVKQGGKLVLISPESGRYTRDNPREQFELVRVLGWRDYDSLMAPTSGVVQATTTGLFTQAKELTLAGPLPEHVDLPEGATVQARFANEQAAVVSWPCGKGEVLLFVHELLLKDQPSAFVEDLFQWAGVTQRISGAPWFCYAHDGDVRYLMLYAEGKPVANRTFTVKIHDLPDGMYRVRNIGPDPLDLGLKDAGEWRAGVRVPLKNGMLVLQFTPLLGSQ